MFKPLAYTKTLAMLIAAGMAITLDPALRLLLTRVKPFAFQPHWLCQIANTLLVGKIRSEEDHLISRWMMNLYEPLVRWTLRWKWAVISAAVAVVAISIPVFLHVGSEFMPPLDEGAILYMPSTMPGISISQAQALLQTTDRILTRFPEVDHVLGKAGRAETSTDPAPLSMLETVIILKPRSEWRSVPTWYSSWAPVFTKPMLRHLTPDTISAEELIHRMDESLKVPGVSNAWTMPIKGRIEMLTTGMRTPVGLKISGADLSGIEQIGTRIESLLPRVKGTRGVFAERTSTGHFVDFQWNREQLARYGLSIEDAQLAIANAIGGEDVTTAVQGRERYPVNVRYMRDFRSDLGALQRVLVPAGGHRQVALGELAEIRTSSGPAMIRDENGMLTGYVYVDVADRDPEGYVADARALLRDQLKLQPGYAISWSGQYEAMERVKQRLTRVVPLTLLIVAFLLYANTRSLTKTTIILLAVPFSAVGAVCFLYLAGYNLSVGVWVGLIALLGIDAETGVFMLLYLDLAYEDARRRGRLNSISDLSEAIVQGAAKRLRPKFMTFATMCAGLLPILWSTGTGSEVMKRIAAPMVGGILTSFILELMVYPAIYAVWRQRSLTQENGAEERFSHGDSEATVLWGQPPSAARRAELDCQLNRS
jgi:Cu(I)/Ag(I) efflux system membrane protein CusA/SilA